MKPFPSTTGTTCDYAATTSSYFAKLGILVVACLLPGRVSAQSIISSLDLDDISRSGEHTTEQLLRDLPVTNANGVPLANNAVNPTRGASSVSLRGMDPADTLVLVDRKRVASFPVGSAFTQPFIDLYAIPLVGIESIEILRDGDTAVYGANAVAGTINLNFRQGYRGVEASVEYGNTLDKDSSEFSTALVFGVGNDRTDVSGFVDYYHRNSIFNRDRAFSATPPFLSTNSSPFNLQLSGDVVIAAGGIPANPDPISPLTLFAHAPFFTNGLAPAAAYSYAETRTSLFNFNRYSGSFPESERYGGYVRFSHQVLGDEFQTLVIYGDTFYQNVKTRNELAPAATGSFQTIGQPTLAIPPRTPIAPGAEPPNTPSHAETRVPADAFNPFNPFQQIISGSSRARLAEFGNRVFRNDTDTFFSTIGVKGDGFFDGTWGYDAAFRYSQVKNTETHNDVSASRFNRILNAADPLFNPASSEFIGTTIAYNPFGDYRVPISTNAPAIAFATVHPKEVDVSKLATIELNIYTTALCKLPAGPIGFAFGGQFRREALAQAPDLLVMERDTIGQPATFLGSFNQFPVTSPDPFTNGGRKVFAVYAEAQVPIFGGEASCMGLHALELKIAGRYEDWLNNDTNAAVPDLGLLWKPFDDSFTIRANWQEGFREPSLQELYQTPRTSTILNAFGGPLTLLKVTSNPGLQPEKSRSFNAGFSYSPTFIHGLTLSADIFDVEITGRINTNPDPNEIVDRYLIGKLLPGEMVLLDPFGGGAFIQTLFRNEGREQSRGVDIALKYVIPTSLGQFTTWTEATYLDSFRLAESAEMRAPEFSNRNSSQLSDEGYIKWKGRSQLTWSWNGLDLSAIVRYTDGFREQIFSASFTGANQFHYVKATWFVDLQGSYKFNFLTPVEWQPVAGYSKGKNEITRGKDGKPVETGQTANYSMPRWKHLLNTTTITLGCNNIFGQDPPDAIGFAFTNGINYPGFLYDANGRFLYARLTKQF